MCGRCQSGQNRLSKSRKQNFCQSGKKNGVIIWQLFGELCFGTDHRISCGNNVAKPSQADTWIIDSTKRSCLFCLSAVSELLRVHSNLCQYKYFMNNSLQGLHKARFLLETSHSVRAKWKIHHGWKSNMLASRFNHTWQIIETKELNATNVHCQLSHPLFNTEKDRVLWWCQSYIFVHIFFTINKKLICVKYTPPIDLQQET